MIGDWSDVVAWEEDEDMIFEKTLPMERISKNTEAQDEQPKTNKVDDQRNFSMNNR